MNQYDLIFRFKSCFRRCAIVQVTVIAADARNDTQISQLSQNLVVTENVLVGSIVGILQVSECVL